MPIGARGVFLALAAAAPVGVAGLCHAQQAKVELRIVERTNQITVSPTDAVLNFAVQGRVLDGGLGGGGGTVGLGGFAFAIILNGESPSHGTLARDAITKPDNTYFEGITGAPPGSWGGVAHQYGYLIGLNVSFNGLINASGGGWTQTPSQDIGLVSGFAAGSYLLSTPGVDDDFSGAPDTAVGDTAILPPAIMQDYFGAGGNWIDLFRFRYTVTNFTSRVLDLHLVSTSADPDPTAYTFTRLESTDNSWGMVSTLISVPPEDITGLKLQVIPAPATMLGAVVIGAAAARRRRHD